MTTITMATPVERVFQIAAIVETILDELPDELDRFCFGHVDAAVFAECERKSEIELGAAYYRSTRRPRLFWAVGVRRVSVLLIVFLSQSSWPDLHWTGQ